MQQNQHLSSSLFPSSDITHNATQPLMACSKSWVGYANNGKCGLELLASKREEESTTNL